MNYSDYMNKIAYSNIVDWKYHDELEHFLYMPDIAISMENVQSGCNDEVREEWIETYFESKVYRNKTRLFYKDGVVDDFDTIYISEEELNLPYPRVTDMTISPLQYGIGKVINLSNTSYVNAYDLFLDKAGIRVRKE